MKVAPVYRFLWISKAGPKLRHFSSVTAFDGYVAEVRRLCGRDSVDFRSPVLAVGVLIAQETARQGRPAQ